MDESQSLYEILVPTQYLHKGQIRYISTRRHKAWHKKVIKIAGGLTILSKSLGKWQNKNAVWKEAVIPCRIACTAAQIEEIVQFTLKHYDQLAVMYYKITDDVKIVYRNVI